MLKALLLAGAYLKSKLWDSLPSDNTLLLVSFTLHSRLMKYLIFSTLATLTFDLKPQKSNWQKFDLSSDLFMHLLFVFQKISPECKIEIHLQVSGRDKRVISAVLSLVCVDVAIIPYLHLLLHYCDCYLLCCAVHCFRRLLELWDKHQPLKIKKS